MPGDPQLLPVFAARQPVDMHLPMTWGDLVSVSTLTRSAAAYLDAAVRARLTILVTGEPHTGRTIMLNVLGAATSDSNDCTYAIERLHYLTFYELLPFATSIQTAPVVDATGDTTRVRDLVRHLVKMQAERIIANDAED
jgi:pilus assembly protein CpaF